MLNQTVLIGRLCADPELRKTGNGKSVVSLRLAVQRQYVPAGKERETDFFDVVCWNGTAEFVGKYMSKGRVIAVVGSLNNRSWTDKNGNNRVTTEVIAQNVYFADSASNGKRSGEPVNEYSQISGYDDESPDPLPDDEDLPF